jgi:hypothetical protein
MGWDTNFLTAGPGTHESPDDNAKHRGLIPTEVQLGRHILTARDRIAHMIQPTFH